MDGVSSVGGMPSWVRGSVFFFFFDVVRSFLSVAQIFFGVAQIFIGVGQFVFLA